MCYSAQIRAEYARYLRQYGAELSLEDYFELFWRRLREGRKVRVPRSMEMVFAEPGDDRQREIKALIDEFNAAEANRLEQEIFKQRKRLADAQRSLQTRTTKKAAEDRRIATDKVGWALGKLAALRRAEPVADDLRIFPGWLAPVMVGENGRRVVKPMRYQCRPAGKPASHDTQFPGTYNARRDNLEGFWRGQFGHTHGIMLADAFFENVKRDGANVVLEFRPRSGGDMLVACLWSRWTAPGEPELLSFAAITDEPPPEVAAAGHDRCIIPIKPEHVEAWLNPEARTLRALYDILDDRERPYYEHRLAA
jgi:putative SOS response-associated peptidase YedK